MREKPCLDCGGSLCVCSLRRDRKECLDALKRIAYQPFGPSDASAAYVLGAITELARYTVEKAEAK